VAGSLYAIARAYMNPDVFPVVLSVYLVAALALGGVDSFVGLILGAAAIYVLQNRAGDVTSWINHLPHVNLNAQRPGMPDVIFGGVLILVLILLPTGVGGALRRLFGPLTTRLYSKS
jgi:branched-chain amino acid transport system permease protein